MPVRICLVWTPNAKDQPLVDALIEHLQYLIDREDVIVEGRHTLLPGARMDQEALGQIQAADIVIPLISSASTSSASFRNDLRLASALSQNGRKAMAPLLLRDYDWRVVPELARAELKFLGTSGEAPRPVKTRHGEEGSYDDKWKRIIDDLRKLARIADAGELAQHYSREAQQSSRDAQQSPRDAQQSSRDAQRAPHGAGAAQATPPAPMQERASTPSPPERWSALAPPPAAASYPLVAPRPSQSYALARQVPSAPSAGQYPPVSTPYGQVVQVVPFTLSTSPSTLTPDTSARKWQLVLGLFLAVVLLSGGVLAGVKLASPSDSPPPPATTIPVLTSPSPIATAPTAKPAASCCGSSRSCSDRLASTEVVTLTLSHLLIGARGPDKDHTKVCFGLERAPNERGCVALRSAWGANAYKPKVTVYDLTEGTGLFVEVTEGTTTTRWHEVKVHEPGTPTIGANALCSGLILRADGPTGALQFAVFLKPE